MVLIVEDGSRPQGANSFCDVAGADAHLVPRGLWPAGSNEADEVMTVRKEAALLRAADWLDGLSWKGRKVNGRQPLCWPRTGVLADGEIVPPDEVPRAVVLSQLEMAVLVFRGVDVLAPVETGVLAMSEALSEGLDVISESKNRSVSYGPQGGDMLYTAAVAPIRPLLLAVPGQRGGGGCRTLERG